jgi:thiol:disulfide interchange protein
MRSIKPRLTLALSALALLPAAGLRADPEYPKTGPDVYDVHADGSAQIATAVATAAVVNKRVILVFGANWCIECHRLSATFKNDAGVAKALEAGFIVVKIDVNQRHGTDRNEAVVERYGNPIAHGVPVLVVLDSDGKLLTTKDSGEWEEGEGHRPAKILAFLSAWALPMHP